MFCFFGSHFSTRISLLFRIRFRIYPWSSFVLIFWTARFDSENLIPVLLFNGKLQLKAKNSIRKCLLLNLRTEIEFKREVRTRVEVLTTRPKFDD